ncbi:phospholipase A2 inhibitor and Ly6/PLAUR domain-containing protein precursor [Cricetulus griseus]|uniref:Phospholipase A2 inhibitor and Ly6/PLAUR domain-containing protein n=1 Tax=Cricetulus griseus TaxID=10029 RepID=A0A061HTZ0_CRIGR|nr:phospholipase A2 inhibitor and Ly6/PLAUR domain-containing protein precursor [Cricetulus griseus]
MKTCEAGKDACVVLVGESSTSIINTKFATRGCATESACHTKIGAEVPSSSYLYFLRRADCLPAPYPPGRVAKIQSEAEKAHPSACPERE